MKLLLAIVALAVCIGFRNVECGPAPAPVKLAYPWTEWLKLRPGGLAAAAALSAATPAPAASDDDLVTFLKRAILPVPKKSKDKVAATTAASAADAVETTTKPKLIDVGDFWAAPTVGPNITDPVVIDPAYWAAKKTMFISRLFAALAKQVLNSTGSVTTTTESPNDALLKEIDTVLLSDVARAVVGEDPATAPAAAEPAPAKPVDFFASFKTALKASAKAKKKAKAAKTPKPTVAAPTPAPASPTAPAVPPTTPHPTLDYSLLAKALLS